MLFLVSIEELQTKISLWIGSYSPDPVHFFFLISCLISSILKQTAKTTFPSLLPTEYFFSFWAYFICTVTLKFQLWRSSGVFIVLQPAFTCLSSDRRTPLLEKKKTVPIHAPLYMFINWALPSFSLPNRTEISKCSLNTCCPMKSSSKVLKTCFPWSLQDDRKLETGPYSPSTQWFLLWAPCRSPQSSNVRSTGRIWHPKAQVCNYKAE